MLSVVAHQEEPHPQELAARQLFEAMADPGGAQLLRFLSAQTLWTVHGVGPFTGEFFGIDEIYQYWRTLMSRTAGTLTFEVVDIAVEDDRIAVNIVLRAERGDLRLDTPQLVELAMNGGKIERAWFVLEHPEVFDAFFAADISGSTGRRLRRTFAA